MLSGLYVAWTVKGQGIRDKLKLLLNYNGKSMPLLFLKNEWAKQKAKTNKVSAFNVLKRSHRRCDEKSEYQRYERSLSFVIHRPFGLVAGMRFMWPAID